MVGTSGGDVEDGIAKLHGVVIVLVALYRPSGGCRLFLPSFFFFLLFFPSLFVSLSLKVGRHIDSMTITIFFILSH